MTTFNNTRELLEAWPDLDDDIRATLLSAISSRGKFKGYVLATAPPMNAGDKYIAWQALMGELAPVRMSIGGMMFMSKSQREVYDRLEKAMEGNLGTALRAQEPALRWSLFAYHYNVVDLRAQYYNFVQSKLKEAS